MNFQEKYDSIVCLIEEMLQSGYSKDDIINRLPLKFGYPKGTLADAFRFIADISLNDYIAQRNMIHLLQYRFDEQCTLDDLVSRFNLSDVPTFSKRCKKYFGLSPSEISPDWLQKQEPLTLQNLLKSEATSMNTLNSAQKATDFSFGVSKEQFHTIKDALEFCSIYGFSEDEAEFAYNLSQKNNVSLETSFEFVDELKLFYGNIHLVQNSKSVPFDILTYLCFHFHLSVSEANEDIWNLGLRSRKTLSKPLKMALEVYYCKPNSLIGYSIEECKEIGDSLCKNGWTDFDLNDILLYAYSDDVDDVIDVIENYTDYMTEFDKMTEECMSIDFSDNKSAQSDLEDAYDEFLSYKSDVSSWHCDCDPDYNIHSDDADFDYDEDKESLFDF